MLPLVITPPAMYSVAPVSTLIWNWSPTPDVLLSVTTTWKVHGTPLFLLVPANVAVSPLMAKDVIDLLWTLTPAARSRYSS